MMHKKYLAVDMGNSRCKIGTFIDGALQEVRYIAYDEPLDKAAIASLAHGAPLIASSVNDREEMLGIFREQANPYYYLTHHTPVPVKTLYRTPETLGKDRLAGLIGARRRFPDRALLVVDTGTCMTYDLLDRKGIHRGGNISPGIEMRYQIMHDATANLPRVSRRLNEDILGMDTLSALQNGGLYGIICEIEGVAHRIAKEFRNFVLILTGGDAKLVGDELAIPYEFCPNLVLEGLYEILKYNEH